MRIDRDIKLDYCDVLFRPKRSTLRSRNDVNLQRSFRFKHSGRIWKGVPIMAANMDGVGTACMARALGEKQMFTCLVKSYQSDQILPIVSELSADYLAVSTGINESDLAKLHVILKDHPEVKFICMDVANGYGEHFANHVEKIRERYPNHTIIAGNVVTADMTQELILRGADIVKVGIGQGSACTTRIQTGVGYPQLSAVIECADAAHGLGGHIIADGGCTCPGDVAKAFGAGADFVMLGGMLAGHDEGGGEKHYRWKKTGHCTDAGDDILETQTVIKFYGMSSETAMNKHHGGMAEYRSSEGRTVLIPYRGAVENTVNDILGGLRSTCTYVGAKTLKELSKCTTFVQVNNGRQYNTIFDNPNTPHI
jgi:GMP reductase